MSGTLDLIQRAYVGLEIRDDVVYFGPRLTERLDGLSFQMQFRRTPIRVTLEGSELTVAALADGFSAPIRVGVGEEVRELDAGARCTFTIADRRAAPSR